MNLHSGPAKTFLVLHKLVEQVSAEYLKDAVAVARRRRSRENLKAGTLQIKVDFRKCQRVVRAVRRNLAQLVRFRSKKFAARRDVEEQVFHCNLRAARKCSLALRYQLSTSDFDRRAD